MQHNRTAPIGLFDSGVGGLTVVREIFRMLPYESVVYYADTAHVPYGSRPPKEIKQLALKCSSFLVEQGCKMIIIACNTSTALAYEEVAAAFDLPVLGIIEPGVDKALEITKNNRIGVIGTAAAIKSDAHRRMLEKKNPAVLVKAISCPPFVPFVEKGQVEGDDVTAAVRRCLEPLKYTGIDCLLLGCTHYPFLFPIISEVLGSSITLVDPAGEAVRQARKILSSLDCLKGEGPPQHRFFASGDPVDFRRAGRRLLGRDLGNVQGV